MSSQYPLEQLVAIKQKRLEAAEKALTEKKALLAKEQETLASLEKQRDQVKEHYQFKLTQIRESLDQGTSTDKIQQMKDYLKIVSEDLNVEEKKVQNQLKNVKQAEEQVEQALQELFRRQKDIEKLNMHQKEWKQEVLGIEQKKENLDNDETGSAGHARKNKKK